MKAREIAARLSVSRSTVVRRARKERWPYRVLRSRGGDCHDYELASLPEDVRTLLVEDIADQTVDWFDRMIRSSSLKRLIAGFVIFAAGYFVGVTVRILQG